MRKAALLTAVALAGLTAPAAAQAATTIGSTSGTPGPGPSSPFYFFQVGSAAP